MANDSKVVLGDIERGAFETVGRTETWSEQRNMSVVIVGKVSDIFDAVKPGDAMSAHPNWFKGQIGTNYFVKTIDATSEDGVSGALRLSLVKCPNGKTKPFNVTWDVGMEEVQMRLINHPMIIKYGDRSALLKWEDTPKGQRVLEKKKNGKPTGEYEYQYRDKWNSSKGMWDMETIEGDWNIAYCDAVTQGIDTFNKYLPVITKNSFYLELPGVSYSQDHVVTGGTIRDFTGTDVIGKFNVPELKVSGYIDNKDGVWFKNGDKFTSQADGSWTRTESWVFTNDPRHMWIYTNKLD